MDRGLRRRSLLAGGTVAVLAVTLGVATAAPSGALRPVEEQFHTSLSNANDVTVAPDGRHVYGVGFASNEIGVFTRNATTGAIAIADDTSGDGLLSPNSVVITADGDYAYVAGNVSNSVHAYERSASGSLANIDSVVDGVSGADGLAGAYDVAVSKDGRHVYATGSDENAVALMFADADGELQWADAFLNGIEGIEDLETPRGIAISPDDRNVYVAGADDGSVVTFRRFPATGQLDFVESDTFASQSQDVALSPDGTRVYVGFDEGVRTFRRNTTTGALTLIGLTEGPLSTVTGVAASPDGGNVYANANSLDDGVVTMATTPNARLRFVEFDEVVEFTDPAAVAVSRDGRHVYLAGGTGGDGHIAVFSRQPKLELKGKKKQKAGKAVKVKAGCSADCSVKVKGKGLKPAAKQLRAGKAKTLKLKPKGSGPNGNVTLKGKAKSGNRSAAHRLKVKLK